MTNDTNIIVPKGITPVHSFDLWGVLVVQDILGPRVLDAYQELMDDNGTAREVVQKNIANYEGVLQGDVKALEDKKGNVDRVEDPLWDAYLAGRIDVNFDGALYDDCLVAMSEVVSADEGFCILTTGNSPWVQKALTSVDQQIGAAMRKLYSGDKKKAEVYEATADDIARTGGQMVSHTEDQMKGLAGLLASGLKRSVNGVYVERKQLATRAEVLGAGIDMYITDLKDVGYTSMVQ